MSVAEARLRKALAFRLALDARDFLASEVARLTEENDSLQRQLAWAQDAAEANADMRDVAMDRLLELCPGQGAVIGLTLDGVIVDLVHAFNGEGLA